MLLAHNSAPHRTAAEDHDVRTSLRNISRNITKRAEPDGRAVNDENRKISPLEATAGEIVASPSATDKAFAWCRPHRCSRCRRVCTQWPHRRSRCTRVHAIRMHAIRIESTLTVPPQPSAAPYHTVPPQLGCAGWLCRLLRCSVWRSVQRQEAFNDRSCCKSSAAKETPRVP